MFQTHFKIEDTGHPTTSLCFTLHQGDGATPTGGQLNGEEVICNSLSSAGGVVQTFLYQAHCQSSVNGING